MTIFKYWADPAADSAKEVGDKHRSTCIRTDIAVIGVFEMDRCGYQRPLDR